MSFEAMRQYHNSVIENEVKQGILDIRGNTKNTCLAFLREIKNFNIHDTRGGKTLINQKPEMLKKLQINNKNFKR